MPLAWAAYSLNWIRSEGRLCRCQASLLLMMCSFLTLKTTESPGQAPWTIRVFGERRVSNGGASVFQLPGRSTMCFMKSCCAGSFPKHTSTKRARLTYCYSLSQRRSSAAVTCWDTSRSVNSTLPVEREDLTSCHAQPREGPMNRWLTFRLRTPFVGSIWLGQSRESRQSGTEPPKDIRCTKDSPTVLGR